LRKQILHPYSDADDLGGVEAPCYDPHEALAEKIRALAAQRRYAISRDLYDVDRLRARCQVDVGRLAGALPQKMRIKGLPYRRIDLLGLKSRRHEFEADWRRNLVHLLARNDTASFESAWDAAIALMEQVNDALPDVPEEG